MSTNPEHVDVLGRALDQMGDLLAAIRPDQLHDATPCRDWDVAQLAGHVMADPARLLAMAKGEEVDWAAPLEPAAAGSDAEFRRRAADLLAHWRAQGAEAPATQVDWQTAEFAVHAWDLAQAIGWTGPLDEEVAERGYGFMSTALKPDNRGDAFGPEQPAPDDADGYERIAAFAGRRVG